jgi:hypothetical protein
LYGKGLSHTADTTVSSVKRGWQLWDLETNTKYYGIVKMSALRAIADVNFTPEEASILPASGHNRTSPRLNQVEMFPLILLS